MSTTKEVETPSTTKKPTSFRHPLIAGIVEEGKKLGVPEHIFGPYVQNRYRLSFGISATADMLRGITAESRFVSLDDAETEALAKGEEGPVLAGIERRIDEALATVPGAATEGAFVKLDSRSPKDALVGDVRSEGVRALVVEHIKKHAAISGVAPGQKMPAQCALNGLMAALQEGLRVRNGKQAVALLSKSWRVREDLHSARSLSPFARTGIALRSWVPGMNDQPWNEYRAFVFENKLTAASQYDHLCYYPQVVENGEKISRVLRSFFDSELAHRLEKLSTYVVDLFVDVEALAGGKTEGVVQVVELNSFESWTGACLFSWGADNDVIFGRKPFELRVVTKPAPDETLLDMIPSPWIKFIQETFPDPTTSAKKESRCVIC